MTLNTALILIRYRAGTGRRAVSPSWVVATMRRVSPTAGGVAVTSAVTLQRARPGASTFVRHLTRRYLSGVQRCPDRSVTWHDRHSPGRTRSPGVGSRLPRWLPHWLPVT